MALKIRRKCAIDDLLEPLNQPLVERYGGKESTRTSIFIFNLINLTAIASFAKVSPNKPESINCLAVLPHVLLDLLTKMVKFGEFFLEDSIHGLFLLLSLPNQPACNVICQDLHTNEIENFSYYVVLLLVVSLMHGCAGFAVLPFAARAVQSFPILNPRNHRVD